MLQTLKSVSYRKELIESLLKSRFAGVATNVIAPILFFILFQSIPSMVLYIWVFLHFTTFVFRIIVGNKLLKNLHIYDGTKIKKELSIYLFILFISSLLWGGISIYTVIYTTDLHIVLLMAIILAIVSGAIATIGSVYHAIFIYIIVIFVPFIISLLLLGHSALYYSAAVFLFVYMFIVIFASYRNYKLLESGILQREKIELLNSSLEQRVAQAIRDAKRKDIILQEQSRLAQMGEMISMIAHQWRQPLASISSLVNNVELKIAMGKFNLEKQEEREEFLNLIAKTNTSINERINFLSTTVDDFRNFFKPNKTKELLPLTTSLQRALQIVESAINAKGIAISKEYKCDENILLFHNEMTQVILNILKNAEDNFLEKKTKNPKIEITTYKTEDRCFINISDNGGGIREDILPNIFDPYFSTKNEKNGTGLGLYMSKIMIEEHNDGKLLVKNTEDGARFTIELLI